MKSDGIGLWQRLLGEAGRPLLDAVAAEPAPDTPAAVARWRKQYPAELVRAAMELVTARRKAADKLAAAEQLAADAVGVEQATAIEPARYKAQRFAELSPQRVFDLCCGIGGDTMALAVCAPVIAVDSHPLRAWMARHNARQTGAPHHAAMAVDVTNLPLHNEVFHMDPSRRNERGRVWRIEDYQPGPDFIDDLRQRCPTGAIKLSPGIDTDDLDGGEIEFISHRGALTQAVWWLGDLARHRRSATALPAHATLTGEPDDFLPATEPMRYLLAIDPAVERARLIHVLIEQAGAATVHPQLGLLTADRPIDSPFLTAYELLAVLPWRVKKAKQWLAEHDGGVVDVKTRGGAVDPDTAAKQLRGKGETPYVVFVLRFDREVRALITQRHSSTNR